MKYKIVGIFVCMLMIAAVFFPAAETINEKVIWENSDFENQASLQFCPGEFIVKLKKDTMLSISSFEVLNERYHVSAVEKMFSNTDGTILENIYIVHVPLTSDILSIVQEYSLCPDVVYAEPNSIAFVGDIPNDPAFSTQWYLHNTGHEFSPGVHGTPDADIDAPEAWDIEKGNPDVVIAIPDTGIDYNHPDLVAHIWNNADEIPSNGIDDDSNGYIDDIRGWDFVYYDNDPKDDRGHGTMIAGVAAAIGNNGIGIAGVSWNSKIMSVKVIHKDNWGEIINISKGIKYAVDNGADIISMSMGWEGDAGAIRDVVNYAYDKGIYLCAIANNNNNSRKQYPAAYKNVTGVGGTDQNDNRYWQSSYGTWVDMAAPASYIYSTMPTYHVVQNDPPYNRTLTYGMGNGTSFACPMVAGVAALLLSKDPSLTPHEIDAILCANVDPYYSDKYIGTGRLNAQKALIALQLKEGVQLKGGFGVKMVMTNNGPLDITNTSWQIHVVGGGKINTTINGTIDIKAGESQSVSTGIVFGLGGITISAQVAGIERTATGTQMLIYSMVK